VTTTTSGRPFAPYTPPASSPSIRPAPRPRRVYPPWLAPLIVGATVLAVCIATMSPWPVGVFYDDGIYLILGKALATGEGYRYLNLPGHPAGTHYPPGYPALLAILWLVGPAFPENVALFKFANAVLLSLAAVGFYAFSRRQLGLGHGLAGGAILLGCLTVPVLAVTGVLFSEPLFLALLAVALPACERALREEDTRSVVIAAVLAGVTTLVRSLGLPVVAALVVGLVLRKRYHAAAIAAAVAGVMLVPWHVWTAVHADGLPRVVTGSYGSYTGAFGEALDANGIAFLGRIAAYNLKDLARPIGAVFAPGVGGATRALIVLAVAGVMSVGVSVLVRRAPATALFLLGYATIVVAWPYAVDRFLWGVWPLLLITLALGAAVGFRGARERGASGLRLVGHATLAVAAGALVLGLVRYNAHGYRQRWWDSAQRAVARQLLPLVEWTERHTHRDDVIASDGDPLLYLYTGRHTVPTARWAIEAYPATADSATRVADMQELLAVYNPRYVLVSSNKASTGPAAAALRNAPRLGLEMLTILPGGGAAFATTPDVKRK
jgi:hypothetical protein